MATTTKTAIDRLLDRQNREINRLSDDQARRTLRALEDARRDLRERLLNVDDTATPYTAQQLRGVLAQTEAGVFQLQERLGEVFTAAEIRAHETALDHLLALVKANEPDFADAIPSIRIQAAAAMSERKGLLLHRHSINRYGADLIDRIQRELVLGQVSGLTIRQTADRITATNASVFASLRGRGELIARMESNRVYNDGHLLSMKELAEDTDEEDDPDPLLKRADEFFDNRNNPISRVLHGMTAKLDEPFVVSRAKVLAMAALMKKSASGIVWPLVGANYRGANYPAHFNDRGRIVAHRASWDEVTRFEIPETEDEREKRELQERVAEAARRARERREAREARRAAESPEEKAAREERLRVRQAEARKQTEELERQAAAQAAVNARRAAAAQRRRARLAAQDPGSGTHFGPETSRRAMVAQSDLRGPRFGRKPGASRTALVRRAWKEVPLDVWTKAEAKGARALVADTIPDWKPHLRGVRPRGWTAGSTWDDVRGAQSLGEAVVALRGTLGGGSFSGFRGIALHEYGHAIDFVGATRPGRGSRASWFRRATTRAKLEEWSRKRHRAGITFGPSADYFLQAGGAGKSEAWAEILSAAWDSKADREILVDVWGADFLTKLSREVDRCVQP